MTIELEMIDEVSAKAPTKTSKRFTSKGTPIKKKGVQSASDAAAATRKKAKNKKITSKDRAVLGGRLKSSKSKVKTKSSTKSTGRGNPGKPKSKAHKAAISAALKAYHSSKKKNTRKGMTSKKITGYGMSATNQKNYVANKKKLEALKAQISEIRAKIKHNKELISSGKARFLKTNPTVNIASYKKTLDRLKIRLEALKQKLMK